MRQQILLERRRDDQAEHPRGEEGHHQALRAELGLALVIEEPEVSVSLLAGIIPVPGGIGVAELGISVGLAAVGLTPEAALATALAFRIATF